MTYTKDSVTGWRVHEHLVKLGLETPFEPRVPSQHAIEGHFAAIMREMGLDLGDDSLCETPKRVAKMYIEQIFYGLDYNNFPKATVVSNKMGYDEMLVEKNIKVHSLCEHHAMPILGSAFVAYIPDGKVVGLSKLHRIVDFFARRPQIQERLTAQIFHAFQYLLGVENVAVVIEAEHLCVKVRGCSDPCSSTTTSKLGGAFRNPEVRAEFISLCKGLNHG